MYNSMGQLVYITAVKNQNLSIPTFDLSEGIYAIRLVTDGNQTGTTLFEVVH